MKKAITMVVLGGLIATSCHLLGGKKKDGVTVPEVTITTEDTSGTTVDTSEAGAIDSSTAQQ